MGPFAWDFFSKICEVTLSYCHIVPLLTMCTGLRSLTRSGAGRPGHSLTLTLSILSDHFGETSVSDQLGWDKNCKLICLARLLSDKKGWVWKTLKTVPNTERYITFLQAPRELPMALHWTSIFCSEPGPPHRLYPLVHSPYSWAPCKAVIFWAVMLREQRLFPLPWVASSCFRSQLRLGLASGKTFLMSSAHAASTIHSPGHL